MRIEIAVALVVIPCFTPTSLAESLWQRGRNNPVSLVADNRARRVGDIVTILIEERQKVKNDENMKTEKTSSSGSTIQYEPLDEISDQLGTGNILDDLLPIDFTSSREFEGDSDYSKEGSFSTRITALVLDVQPNGNLVVEGRRRVVLDGEEKWMTVSGVVRSFDVKFDNTVVSALVANANVKYSSNGPLDANVKRGWLDRFTDFIWPF